MKAGIRDVGLMVAVVLAVGFILVAAGALGQAIRP